MVHPLLISHARIRFRSSDISGSTTVIMRGKYRLLYRVFTPWHLGCGIHNVGTVGQANSGINRGPSGQSGHSSPLATKQIQLLFIEMTKLVSKHVTA